MRNFTSKQRSLWGNVTGIDTFPEMFGFQHTFKEMAFYILKLYRRDTGNALRAGAGHSGRFLCLHRRRQKSEVRGAFLVRRRARAWGSTPAQTEMSPPLWSLISLPANPKVNPMYAKYSQEELLVNCSRN